MKNRVKRGVIICSSLFLALSSCKKEEVQLYSGPTTVNILHSDGKSFAEISFLALAKEITEFKYDLNVTIQATSVNYDRSIKLELGKENSALLGRNFVMDLDVVLPAGAASILVPCVVKKEGLAELENGLLIDLQVAKSKDFDGQGLNNNCQIKISANFPTSWYNGGYYIDHNLGKCTKAKYKFIYDQKETIDLSNWAGMNEAIALKNELNDIITRRNTTPGIKDEDKYLDDDGSEMNFSPTT